MTAAVIVLAALAAFSTFAAFVFGSQRRRDEETIAGLWDEISAHRRALAQEKRKVARLLDASSQYHYPPGLREHTDRALRMIHGTNVVEFGPQRDGAK